MQKATYKDIDGYIKLFPENTNKVLEQIRQTIKKAAPNATEAIAYGIPTFKLNGNLVHFAGYDKHIGFYPGAAGIKDFEKDLTAYKTSKGTVQFPLDQKLPLALITKIVKYRVIQNRDKQK